MELNKKKPLSSKIRTFLILSLTLNLILISLLCFSLIRHDKIAALKSKISLPGSSERQDDYKKSPWYYKNSRHWKETKSLYEVMPNDSNEIIFIGNSLTFGCEWSELFANPRIKNRGIGGDNTEGVLARLSEICESTPEKVFINLGTNDLAFRRNTSEILTTYSAILDQLKTSSPNTKIYVQSVLPTNNDPERNNDSIIALNKKLETLAAMKSANYIHLYDHFLDEVGNLNAQFSFDGLHLKGEGYLLWKKLIEKYVNER